MRKTGNWMRRRGRRGTSLSVLALALLAAGLFAAGSGLAAAQGGSAAVMLSVGNTVYTFGLDE